MELPKELPNIFTVTYLKEGYAEEDLSEKGYNLMVNFIPFKDAENEILTLYGFLDYLYIRYQKLLESIRKLRNNDVTKLVSLKDFRKALDNILKASKEFDIIREAEQSISIFYLEKYMEVLFIYNITGYGEIIFPTEDVIKAYKIHTNDHLKQIYPEIVGDRNGFCLSFLKTIYPLFLQDKNMLNSIYTRKIALSGDYYVYIRIRDIHQDKEIAEIVLNKPLEKL
jgi:hypothetical protein